MPDAAAAVLLIPDCWFIFFFQEIYKTSEECNRRWGRLKKWVLKSPSPTYWADFKLSHLQKNRKRGGGVRGEGIREREWYTYKIRDQTAPFVTWCMQKNRQIHYTSPITKRQFSPQETHSFRMFPASSLDSAEHSQGCTAKKFRMLFSSLDIITSLAFLHWRWEWRHGIF